MAKINKNGLTDKQEAFCQEYVKDSNGAQAAIRAGYRVSSAKEIGSENLTKPNITKRVAELQEAIAKKNELTSEMIVKELMKIAFANKKGVAKWTKGGVEFIPSDEMSDDDSATISEISETMTENGGSMKIKQHDKVKALELLAKIQGMLKDKVEVTGKVTLEDLVLKSMELEKE